MIITHLSDTPPGRINEDACWYDDSRLVVIDGAAQRVHAPGLLRLFPAADQPSTVASQAAALVRETIRASQEHDPAALLIAANDALRAAVEAIYGGISLAQVRAVEGDLAELRDSDEAAVRLVLPVCAATAAVLDRAQGTITFAHVADTALFLFYADGRTDCLTEDQVGPYDTAALRHAVKVQQDQGASALADVIASAEARRITRWNALRHNAVGGYGVLNGLPPLPNYMQCGSVPLDGVQALLLCSDGFRLPGPLDETPDERADRDQQMRCWIEQDGLAGYLARLRQLEREDAALERWPRFKVHDDATAIYAVLE